MKIKALRRGSIGVVAVAATVLVLASACGGAGPASVAPSVPPSATSSDAATSSPSAGPVGSPTPVRSGEATVEGPSTIEANTEVDVAWTGPDNQGDYITIVAVGTTKWTVEPYFYTRDGSPGKLVAPVKAGEYELWYVNGADDVAKARRAITVTSLASTLDAPAQVPAGAPFQV
ncbi:MAG: hypothetical protein ACXWXM_09490, partial [Actinomycetota bacterium]